MIKEKISFGDFDSDVMGFDMISRSPDSIEEQEITETIPGVQGVIDYSMSFGQRFFKPMKLNYSFSKFCSTYAERHSLEARVKNQVMKYGTRRLYDSQIPENYYFLAKCSSENVTVSDRTSEVTVTLVFTCNPPFMFCEIPEGNDEWDTFSFDYDVSQKTSFTINNGDDVYLINPGSAAVQPKITVTGTISVTVNGNTVNFTDGTYENTLIYLLPGMNSLALSGTGTISFKFYKELIA